MKLLTRSMRPTSTGGKGKSKGKSKGKGGKSKGKGKGSGGGFRRSFDNRRPMSGLRRPITSSSSTTVGDSPKSTLSGSTAAHGPRFKRYRVQANGVKEVPEDQVTMVDDLSMDLKQEECDVDHVEAEFCFFTTMTAGKAIVDLGATRTITRESTWKLWLEHLDPQEVHVNPCHRDFRFGGGEILRSHYEVTFPAYVNGQHLLLTASVVPGSIPFLLSRPTLEAWGAKQDFANGTMQVMNGEWFKPKRGHRGHYVIDLINKDEIHMIEESPCDPWHIEVILEPNGDQR